MQLTPQKLRWPLKLLNQQLLQTRIVKRRRGVIGRNHRPALRSQGSPQISAMVWSRQLGAIPRASTPRCRMQWAKLMQRVFAMDVLKCPKCPRRLKA